MVGIYKITNELTEKAYIGQSIQIETRWKQHIYNATHFVEKEQNRKLYIAFHQDGIENFSFEVLEECEPTQTVLNEKERYWIQYYNTYNDGYNMTLGGQGEDSWKYDPTLICQLWDEGLSVHEIMEIVGCCRTIVHNRLKGYKDYNCSNSHSRGLLRSKKFKEHSAISYARKYTVQDKEYYFFGECCPVHQYSLMGDYIASYSNTNAAARAVGGKYGDNIRHIFLRKDQTTAYGYQWSETKVDKMPIASCRQSKPVRCLETGKIYTSIREANKDMNIKGQSNISECCKGKRATAGKHPITGEKLHWEYVN